MDLASFQKDRPQIDGSRSELHFVVGWNTEGLVPQYRVALRIRAKESGLMAVMIDEGTPQCATRSSLDKSPTAATWLTVPALPGCVSQGDTRDEVMRNIRKAADLYVEDCVAAGDPVPTEAGREYVELKTGAHE